MTQPFIDPRQYIITRKRKKYKFAKFANSPLCFEHEEWRERPVDVLEVGAGTGLFSVALATNEPKRFFAAIDVKGDRLQTGAYAAHTVALENIAFLRTRGDLLPQLFAPYSIGELWLTFPDPHPKPRSSGRRLTHPTFLRTYASLLRPNGVGLCFKTDAHDLFVWSLEQLVVEGWRICELSFDLHESSLSQQYKNMTTYEARYTGEGLPIYFVRALPPS
ncbi:tRNA (guanosine(46)-N7)-methyltransferase TrmB [Candidatus Saccharibacteria bacterium]|nr:tRNA (guanosine(46)-N7)-methyltransferase TrmB [Candidatus Saccharibacteria bacterium]